MAVHDMRATQKIIKINPNKIKGLEKVELRVKTIEQSVNLILKKLDRIEKSTITEIA